MLTTRAMKIKYGTAKFLVGIYKTKTTPDLPSLQQNLYVSVDIRYLVWTLRHTSDVINVPPLTMYKTQTFSDLLICRADLFRYTVIIQV